MNDALHRELMETEQAWSQAMVRNVAGDISRYMSDDWLLIDVDGRFISRERYLAVVESGELTHEVMDADDWHVQTFGDCAAVITRVQTKGVFQGQPFATLERSTSIYHRRDGCWICVLTQLSPMKHASDHRPS